MDTLAWLDSLSRGLQYGPLRVKESAPSLTINQSSVVVAADTRRILLMMGLVGVTSVNLTTASVATAGKGLVLTSNSPILTLTWEKHGVLVGQGWNALSGATQNIFVMEVIQEYDLRPPYQLQRGGSIDASPATLEPDDFQRRLWADTGSEHAAGSNNPVVPGRERIRDQFSSARGPWWRNPDSER